MNEAQAESSYESSKEDLFQEMADFLEKEKSDVDTVYCKGGKFYYEVYDDKDEVVETKLLPTKYDSVAF